ncbi:hypothetical protein [Streptomyces sp. NPDC052042]|uniref:hypothetical protein n=1 Tax=Streptomyces sp. NPDC052042 TaxID=3365683 RepID=UPI0037D7D496
MLLLPSACTAPDGPGTDDSVPAATARSVRALLDRRAAAVTAHDTDAYLAAVDPRATGLRAAQRRELDDLADVPLASWTYRVTELTGRSTGRVTAHVRLGYRIAGYDRAPATEDRVLDLRRDGADGRWYLTADRPGGDGGGPLWRQGRVGVVHGTHSLVLGVGRTGRELRAIARTADRAVPVVSRGWPERWPRRVLVLVPRSVEDMAGLLGAPAADYRGMAAVTTAGTGGPAGAPADRVIVNPQAYGALGAFGRRIVLTHEIAHVATRARTTGATPVWLSEGFADRVAYRAEHRTAVQAAPELAGAVRRGEVPAALPADEDFGFAGGAARQAMAYEGGRLACELIADTWGERELFAFYRSVAGQRERGGAVERALREVLDITPAEFTARWRKHLRARLG